MDYPADAVDAEGYNADGATSNPGSMKGWRSNTKQKRAVSDTKGGMVSHSRITMKCWKSKVGAALSVVRLQKIMGNA